MWKKMRPPLTTSLVTTVGVDGSVNASPKSWWSPVSYEPAILMLSTQPNSNTTANIMMKRFFVLHLPPQGDAKQVLHTAKPLPYGENELDDVGLSYDWLLYDGGQQFPYLPQYPWMLCRLLPGKAGQKILGDHVVWFAEVVRHGGYGEDGVESVLLHRGRNKFLNVEGELDVEPY